MKKIVLISSVAAAIACFAEYEYRTNSVTSVVHVYDVNTNGVNKLIKVVPIEQKNGTNFVWRLAK